VRNFYSRSLHFFAWLLNTQEPSELVGRSRMLLDRQHYHFVLDVHYFLGGLEGHWVQDYLVHRNYQGYHLVRDCLDDQHHLDFQVCRADPVGLEERSLGLGSLRGHQDDQVDQGVHYFHGDQRIQVRQDFQVRHCLQDFQHHHRNRGYQVGQRDRVVQE